MSYQKFNNVTIKGKEFFRDGGLYLYSPADGYLELDADTALRLRSSTVEVSGAAFRRRTYQYMSGTCDAGWDGRLWTAGGGNEYPTLPDEGVMFFAAKNGNIGAKLPATPVRGATIDIIFCDSGSADTVNGAKTLTLSGNIVYKNLQTGILASMTFSYPGTSISLVGTENPAYWWVLSPSGAWAPAITARG